MPAQPPQTRIYHPRHQSTIDAPISQNTIAFFAQILYHARPHSVRKTASSSPPVPSFLTRFVICTWPLASAGYQPRQSFLVWWVMDTYWLLTPDPRAFCSICNNLPIDQYLTRVQPAITNHPRHKHTIFSTTLRLDFSLSCMIGTNNKQQSTRASDWITATGYILCNN